MKKNLIDYWESSNIIKDKKLLEAFEEIPREFFISDNFKDEAYSDNPLPIGFNQTISQPTAVMLMSQALELKPGQKILEVGTGSGYQAAIISKVVGWKGKVITTEIIPELVQLAKANLDICKIKNVRVIEHDGGLGYKKEAPYDRCIITAACPKIPQPIIEQLKPNGIIVAPVGSLTFGQQMIKLKKTKEGIERKSLGSFVFVPLKGRFGY